MEKTKIGVVTFHCAENSGAVLQCIALQRALTECGYDPIVINYVPQYIKEQYPVLVNPWHETKKRGLSFSKNGSGFIISFFAFLAQNFHVQDRLARKNKFNRYVEKHLTLTKEYVSISELKADPPTCDIYITGSDQLWNKNLTGGRFDPAYFLDFGDNKNHRYSYAISVGKQFDEAYLQEIKAEMDDRFDEVAFRESSLEESFSHLFPDIKCRTVVDPVFLLSGDEWTQYIEQVKVQGKYVLVYALEKNDSFQEILNLLLSENKDLKVIDISQCNLNLKVPNKKVKGFSPGEFLGFIHSADYVVTNSFHCTSFSIIFKKQFTSISHSKGNGRLYDLLKISGLLHRIYDSSCKKEIFEEIDFDAAHKKLYPQIKGSYAYLRGMEMSQTLSNCSAKDNILAVGESDCCGCGSCKLVCNSKAIEMVYNHEGFLYPVVNNELCVSCGLCKKVCPAINHMPIEESPKRYAVKSKSLDTRMASTSGGGYSEISDWIFNSGKGVTYACEFQDDYNVSYTRAINSEGRNKQRGAKYVQCSLEDTFVHILDDLKNDMNVLFIGPSCYIQAGRNYLSSHQYSGRVLFVDTLCHGVPSPLIWKEHREFLKTKYPMPWKSYTFRDKEVSWRGQHTTLITADGKKVQDTRDLNAYLTLYFDGYITRKSCHNCPYASIHRVGDISIGDCWGIELCSPEFDDKKGVSYMQINTEAGEQIFQSIRGNLDILELQENECVQENLKHPSTPSNRREEFWNVYSKSGYIAAIKKYTRYGKINYLKNAMSIIIAKLVKRKN